MIKTCSCCGNSFIAYGTHMYKTKKNGKTQYQCCYSCYRKEGGDTGLYNKNSKTINNERDNMSMNRKQRRTIAKKKLTDKDIKKTEKA